MRSYRVVALAGIAWLALVQGSGDAGDKKGDAVIQELSAKGLRSKLPQAPVNKPVVINDAKDLAKTFAEDADQAALAKQVDFQKQYLLLFSWGGSGQDKLGYEAADGKVRFKHTPGFTRDFRPHVRLFALKKGAAWSVESNR